MSVEIAELPEERLTEPVEAATYVVAEAITNVAKYARGVPHTVNIRRSNGCATVTVCDDGVGGADRPAARACAALRPGSRPSNGRLDVDSPPEQGTASRQRSPAPT